MQHSVTRLRRAAVALALGALVAGSPTALTQVAPAAPPYFGLHPFPFDFTTEALNKVHELAEDHGTLAVVQRDNGIPWAEALKNSRFPSAVENEWNDLARRIPDGRATYLALAPLAEDRVSLHPHSQGSSTPGALRRAKLNDEAVKTAYLNYARRATQRFRPQYLNLGLEAGEMAARKPDRWPEFVDLYMHVRSELKREFPDLQIGISFGLPALMEPDVARRSKQLVEASDYLCLSFYPYMSEFYEKFGAKRLPPPPAQWREPLAWASQYTRKPIAICETGYSARNVDIPAFDLHMQGSPERQAEYVSELGDIARRNKYLFVVWAIAVDYDALYKKLPKGDGRYLLWQNIGFFDAQLRPRPAWDSWNRIVRARDGGRPAPVSPSTSRPAPPVDNRAPAGTIVGFRGFEDLFAGPSTDKIDLDENGPAPGRSAMRWSFSYARNRWQWIARDLRSGDVGGRTSVRFSIRSDRDGPVFVQLEERSGETFFILVNPTRNWQQVQRSLADFSPDPQKRKDGRLDPNQVVKILLADSAGALSNARGARTVWVADWVFE